MRYIEDGQIHTITDESPKGFKGVLFVGRGPDGKEQLYDVARIQRMTPVEEVPVFDLEGEELLDLMPVTVGEQHLQGDTGVYMVAMLIGVLIILLASL